MSDKMSDKKTKKVIVEKLNSITMHVCNAGDNGPHNFKGTGKKGRPFNTCPRHRKKS